MYKLTICDQVITSYTSSFRITAVDHDDEFNFIEYLDGGEWQSGGLYTVEQMKTLKVEHVEREVISKATLIG